MHPILAKIDEVDDLLRDEPSITLPQANMLRGALGELRRSIHVRLTAARPEDQERIRQAQEQGDADRGGYLPAQRDRS